MTLRIVHSGDAQAPPRPPAAEILAQARDVLADYHGYTSIGIIDGTDHAEQSTSASLEVHAARLAAELTSVIGAYAGCLEQLAELTEKTKGMTGDVAVLAASVPAQERM